MKVILINNFGCIDSFKKKLVNNKDFMLDVIEKTKVDKDEIKKSLEKINSKLLKDDEILTVLS